MYIIYYIYVYAYCMNLNLLVHPSKRKGGAKSGEKWATRPKARDWRTTENMSLTPWEGS